MSMTATTRITDEEAVRYRSQFPIFDHTVYLNSCSLGPLSRSAMDALARYCDDWSFHGAPVWWKIWMSRLDEARARFARLINADPDEVAISHSVSSALSTIAGTFNYSRGSAVVCADLDFPTIPYQWLSRRRDGVTVRFARSEDRVRVPVESYHAQMDDTVELIATSHSFYTSGYIQPIVELAQLAHQHGAGIVVDGYHSVGVHPVDVKALDVDFYIGGTLKWLLGGPGLTFIYARRELIPHLEPTATGWFASADQFQFDALSLDWPSTADRLQLGTPSVATAYSGIAGMDMILDADPRRIYERLQLLTDRVVQAAQSHGYEVVSPLDASERGGIVMLRVDQPQHTVAELADRGFTIDHRPGLIRISPHFYNTTEDVDGLMDALADVQRRLP